MERVVRVNARTGAIETAPVRDEVSRWGGRGLIANVIGRDVSPVCDPLGRGNRLIFAPGWLGGSSVAASGRLSVGAKSPLTGGIKEANVGGEAGQKLARIGVRSLVVEDAPDEPRPRILILSRGGGEWLEDRSLDGLGVRETLRRLRERFGASHGLVASGPRGRGRWRRRASRRPMPTAFRCGTLRAEALAQ